MTEDSVLRELPGAQDVIAWFGYWPECHDWELLSLVLNRKGTSHCRLFGFHRTDETDAAGVFIRVKHAIVTFELDDVFDLSLEEFNWQNVINSLTIERTRSEIPPHGEGFRIMFGPIWGLNGYLAAERIRVKLSPGQPSASE